VLHIKKVATNLFLFSFQNDFSSLLKIHFFFDKSKDNFLLKAFLQHKM